MELKTMRYFLAAANAENITKAAELLNMSQPTLSRSLARLENELGTKLFVRGAQGIELTKEGMVLKRRSSEVMELVEKARGELRLCGRDRPLAGDISIGAGELAAVDSLADYVEHFSKRHPHVNFHLYTGSAEHIRERIDRGLTDVGLLLEPVNVERHEFIRLGGVRERWAAIVPPKSPLARLDAVSPKELAEYPIIMVKRPHVRSVLENWFGGYFQNLRVSFTSNLSTNAAHMVRRGLGCALVVEGSVMLWDKSLVCVKPLTPELLSTSVLAWKRGQPMSPAVEKFVAGARIHFKHNAA